MNISRRSVILLGRKTLIHQQGVAVSLLGARCLYSPAAIGLDGYQLMRERVQMQFNEMSDKFRTKMREFVSHGSKNMIFTEDLKHMLYLAEATEEDMQLLEEMMLKFHRQNKSLRFGSFVFGPVVMRMYHHLNRPKEALKIFMNPDMETFFDHIVTFQVLMDLLYENGMYDEVLEVADKVKEKQIPGNRYPRSIIVLAMAAAYKKNTPEAFMYMKELWAELMDAGHMPLRRAITFAAALAINQDAPHIALELISEVPKQNYVTIRNLKASALADVNRPDDALPILRSVLEIDGPQEFKHTFCSEVIDKVRASVDKCDNKEVQHEFQRIVSQLTQLGHISDKPLDFHLCAEIEKLIVPTEVNREQRILAAKMGGTEPVRRGSVGLFYTRQRPGLRDME